MLKHPLFHSDPGAGEQPATLRNLLPHYLTCAKYEWGYAPLTLEKYQDTLRSVIQPLGDMAPGQIRQGHVLAIKMQMATRGAGPARVKSILNGLKSFLEFCQSVGIATLDPAKIRPPRLPKREVVFLTPEEVEQFVLGNSDPEEPAHARHEVVMFPDPC